MELEYELIETRDHQRFYKLNFPIRASNGNSTYYLCLSDAFILNEYERYAFPVFIKGDGNEEYFTPHIHYLEVEGFRIPATEGDYDFLPKDSAIIQSLFVAYNNIDIVSEH